MYVTDIHEWFPSMICSFCPHISKSTMPFKNKAPRNITVYVCAFQMLEFEVLTVCTQNWVAVHRAFSSSNVAIYIRFEFNRQHLNVCHFQTDDM